MFIVAILQKKSKTCKKYRFLSAFFSSKNAPGKIGQKLLYLKKQAHKAREHAVYMKKLTKKAIYGIKMTTYCLCSLIWYARCVTIPELITCSRTHYAHLASMYALPSVCVTFS